MKTVSDIAAMLKRENNSPCLTILYDGKEFEVSCSKADTARSKYLDDALENLAESMRRKANGMAPTRETGAETTASVAICPTCSGLPASWMPGDALKLVCNEMHAWKTDPAPGAVYWFDVIIYGKTKFKWNGSAWTAQP